MKRRPALPERKNTLKTVLMSCVLMVGIMSWLPGSAFLKRLEAEDSASDRLTFVFVRPEKDPMTQWLILIYTEALRRMGIEFVFKEVPAKRASIYSDSGEVDGELGRNADYNETHPNMVRVEENNITAVFSAFVADPAIVLNGWADLQRGAYRVEYRRGIAVCEKRLPHFVPAERLSDITTVHQGIQKLLAGRTDVYVDVEAFVSKYLKSEEFQNISKGRIVYAAGVMEQSFGHAFLHKKHEALVPGLSGILRAMKDEGLFEAYRDQAGMTGDDLKW